MFWEFTGAEAMYRIYSIKRPRRLFQTWHGGPGVYLTPEACLSSLFIDYEQSRFFLIVRREGSENNRRRESWPASARPTSSPPFFSLRSRRTIRKNGTARSILYSWSNGFSSFYFTEISRSVISAAYYTSNKYFKGLFKTPPWRPGVYSKPGV